MHSRTLIVWLVAFHVLAPATAGAVLEEDELRKLDRVIDNLSTAELIGQVLVVGPPGDWRNYSGNPLDNRFIELHVGNLMMSAYHYWVSPTERNSQTWDDMVSLGQVQSFHRAWKTRYSAKNLPPPLLFLDFEGPRKLRSINHTLDPPPPALSLGSTRNAQLIERVGLLVGSQLRLAGFDALLGPVIDLDGTSQGLVNQLIDNRVFSSDPGTVIAEASHYINGVRSTGVFVFPKHYPGYGHTSGRPHDEINQFTGSLEALRDNLEPFRQLHSLSDGLMSAHMTLPLFTRDQVSTFSPVLMTSLLRRTETIKIGSLSVEPLGMRNDAVLISDDLSDMGIAKAGESFGEVAVRALSAGHDLLLFSHLETGHTPRSRCEERYRSASEGGGVASRKCFDLEQLRTTIDHLAHWASTDENLDVLRTAVRRVLLLKARMLQPDDIASGVEMLRSGAIPALPNYELKRPPALNGENAQEVLAHVFEESFLHLNPELSLPNPTSRDLLVVSDRESCGRFRRSFRSEARVTVECPALEGLAFDERRSWMLEQVSVPDHLVALVVSSKESADLVDHLALHPGAIGPGTDVIALVHTTPKILQARVLADIPAVGNFSVHPLAMRATVNFLHGRLQPNDRQRLSTDLGHRGEMYRAANSTMNVMPAAGVAAYAARLGNQSPVSREELEKVRSLALDFQKQNDELRIRLDQQERSQKAQDDRDVTHEAQLGQLKTLNQAYAYLTGLLLMTVGAVLLSPLWSSIREGLGKLDDVTPGKLGAVLLRAVLALKGKRFARAAGAMLAIGVGVAVLSDREHRVGYVLAGLAAGSPLPHVSSPPSPQE